MRRFLNRAAHWWNRRRESSPHFSSNCLPIRLQLEQLEDRRLMNVSYHGGPLLTNPQVETIFYGTLWSTDVGLNQEALALNQFWQYMTTSGPGTSFEHELGMYSVKNYNIGPASFIGTDFTNLDPGTTVTDTAIQSVINAEIASGRVAAPTANTLYFVYTPPATTVLLGSTSGFIGYHFNFTTSSGKNATYAVVPNQIGQGAFPGLTPFQQYTKVSSHEYAEAITDPVVNGPNAFSGWNDTDPNSIFFGSEIGDQFTVEPVIKYLGHYATQAIWNYHTQAGMWPVTATDSPPPDLTSTGGPSFVGAVGGLVSPLLGSFEDWDFSGTAVLPTPPGGPAGVAAPADFLVTINWGDGSPLVSGNGFAVYLPGTTLFGAAGGHTYFKPGTFHVTVSITDTSDGMSTVFTTTATIEGRSHSPLHKDPNAGDTFLQLTPVTQANGLPAVFAVDSGKLGEYSTSSAGNVWSPWIMLPVFNNFLTPVTLSQITVGINQNGSLQAFAVDSSTGNLLTDVQTNGGFSPIWTTLGGSFINTPGTIIEAANQDGSLDVFGITSTGNVVVAKQIGPNSQNFTAFVPVFNFATQIAVAQNTNGLVELFGLGLSGNLITSQQQNNNTLNFGPTVSLGGSLVSLAVGRNANGTIQAFGTNAKATLLSVTQTVPNGTFGTFAVVARNFGNGFVGPNSLAVGTNANGTLQVFGINNLNQNVVTVKQTSPNGPFSSTIQNLGLFPVSFISVGKDAQGRLDVFGIGFFDGLDYYDPSDANGNFTGWIAPM